MQARFELAFLLILAACAGQLDGPLESSMIAIQLAGEEIRLDSTCRSLATTTKDAVAGLSSRRREGSSVCSPVLAAARRNALHCLPNPDE